MERFFFGFCFVGNDDQIVLQLEKVQAYKWVAFKDLKDYLLFDGQLYDIMIKILEIFPYLREIRDI